MSVTTTDLRDRLRTIYSKPAPDNGGTTATGSSLSPEAQSSIEAGSGQTTLAPAPAPAPAPASPTPTSPTPAPVQTATAAPTTTATTTLAPEQRALLDQYYAGLQFQQQNGTLPAGFGEVQLAVQQLAQQGLLTENPLTKTYEAPGYPVPAFVNQGVLDQTQRFQGTEYGGGSDDRLIAALEQLLGLTPTAAPTAASTAGPTTTGSAPQGTVNFTGVAPSLSSGSVALPLFGQNEQTQANLLTQFFLDQGIQPPAQFPVGGTSAVDGQINSLIDEINQPGLSPTQTRLLAEELKYLVDQRAQTAQNISFVFSTAAAPTPTAQPRTVNDFVGGLDAPLPNDQLAPSTDQFLDSATLRMSLANLLDRLEQGGITDEELALAESTLVNDLARNDLIQREDAVNRAASTGTFGGIVGDRLRDLDENSDVARARGLATLRLGALDQQRQAREQAITSMLELIGIRSAEAQAMAQNMTQRRIAQADIAAELEGLDTNARLALEGLGLDADGLYRLAASDQMEFVLGLLQLEQNADAETRAGIRLLLDTLLEEG